MYFVLEISLIDHMATPDSLYDIEDLEEGCIFQGWALKKKNILWFDQEPLTLKLYLIVAQCDITYQIWRRWDNIDYPVMLYEWVTCMLQEQVQSAPQKTTTDVLLTPWIGSTEQAKQGQCICISIDWTTCAVTNCSQFTTKSQFESFHTYLGK